jgi:hypothetical protein
MGAGPRETLGNYRPRHSAWKNSFDSLAVAGLHENWTLAPILGEGFTTPDNVQKKELIY